VTAPDPGAAPGAAPDAGPAGPDALRAFVNERGVGVPPGATALDAVRAFDRLGGTALADDVAAGRRALVDSRGLPVDAATPAHGGAIYRVLPARRAPAPRDDGDAPDPIA
jgi:hypothetical protein